MTNVIDEIRATKVFGEIRAANRSFMEHFDHGDAAAVAALYTPDAKLLPPDSPIVSGTEAIRSFWQGAMDSGVKEARLETMEVESRDDLAYEVGRYTLGSHSKDGEASTIQGKYVVVWQHRDGQWKLHVDIWNGMGG